MPNLLEKLLRKASYELAAYQVARFWKMPDDIERTPCDFMGFTATGRAILIEAKQVKRSSLPIGCAPGLAAHQFVALNEANKANAISLLVWANGDVVSALSWDMVLELSKGRSSIPWKKISKDYKQRFHDDMDHAKLLEPWLCCAECGLE